MFCLKYVQLSNNFFRVVFIFVQLQLLKSFIFVVVLGLFLGIENLVVWVIVYVVGIYLVVIIVGYIVIDQEGFKLGCIFVLVLFQLVDQVRGYVLLAMVVYKVCVEEFLYIGVYEIVFGCVGYLFMKGFGVVFLVYIFVLYIFFEEDFMFVLYSYVFEVFLLQQFEFYLVGIFIFGVFSFIGFYFVLNGLGGDVVIGQLC